MIIITGGVKQFEALNIKTIKKSDNGFLSLKVNGPAFANLIIIDRVIN